MYTTEEKKKLHELSHKILKLPVAELADNLYGLQLFQSKSNPTELLCYEHPSLVFDLKSNLVFTDNMKSRGLSGYDFVAFYENISLLNAREKVNDYFKSRDPRFITQYKLVEDQNKVIKTLGVALPENTDEDYTQLKNLLVDYGLSSQNIDDLIENRCAYLSDKGIVFVCYDENDAVGAAFIYDLKTNEKQICFGSHPAIGFNRINTDRSKLTILNSIEDLFSVFSLHPDMNFYILNGQSHKERAASLTYAAEHLNLNEYLDRKRYRYLYHEENQEIIKDLLDERLCLSVSKAIELSQTEVQAIHG